MEAIAQKVAEFPEELQSISLPDKDLVQELSDRINAVCRYAQCIANAEGDAEVQQTWRDLERQELINIKNLKQVMVSRIERGEFLDDL